MAKVAPLRFLRRALMERACRGLGARGFAAEATVGDDQPLEVQVREYKGHKVEVPGNKVATSKGELVSMFRLMFTMRRMEFASKKLYQARLIRGFCHLYSGQEGICVGMEAATTKQDSLITSYRDHCQYVGRGGSVQAVISELMGRMDGATRGVGGSMHLYKRDANFYGGNGIVGAQIPLGAGIAFTHKYTADGGACFTLYGDGAANQGQKYETLNIAALWKLPVVMVCENNQYGMGTAIHRASFASDFYTRGDYVVGLKVDGMDPLAVKKACAFAKEYVLEKGPIVLEMDTYRYDGHSVSDADKQYRPKEEVNKVRSKRDPIEQVKELLVANEFVTTAELRNMMKEIIASVNESVEQAKAAPNPPNDWVWKNVYVEPLNVALRGVESTSRNPISYDPGYKI